jgi:hypothetical protein
LTAWGNTAIPEKRGNTSEIEINILMLLFNIISYTISIPSLSTKIIKKFIDYFTISVYNICN